MFNCRRACFYVSYLTSFDIHSIHVQSFIVPRYARLALRYSLRVARIALADRTTAHQPAPTCVLMGVRTGDLMRVLTAATAATNVAARRTGQPVDGQPVAPMYVYKHTCDESCDAIHIYKNPKTSKKK